jgi:hypothetical protein
MEQSAERASGIRRDDLRRHPQSVPDRSASDSGHSRRRNKSIGLAGTEGHPVCRPRVALVCPDKQKYGQRRQPDHGLNPTHGWHDRYVAPLWLHEVEAEFAPACAIQPCRRPATLPACADFIRAQRRAGEHAAKRRVPGCRTMRDCRNAVLFSGKAYCSFIRRLPQKSFYERRRRRPVRPPSSPSPSGPVA